MNHFNWWFKSLNKQAGRTHKEQETRSVCEGERLSALRRVGWAEEKLLMEIIFECIISERLPTSAFSSLTK